MDAYASYILEGLILDSKPKSKSSPNTAKNDGTSYNCPKTTKQIVIFMREPKIDVVLKPDISPHSTF
jgi:hypothetical protein